MGLDVNRWFNYAKAKVAGTVSTANRDLDALEAERELDLADKPWLGSDGATPGFDEAKARIEAQADLASKQAGGETEPGARVEEASAVANAPTAEVAAARVELDRQALESHKRLEAIRDELGIDPPEGGSA